MRTLGNIIWLLTGGWTTALGWLIAGVIFYISIVGIPFGLQLFKMAKLSLCPFGAQVL